MGLSYEYAEGVFHVLAEGEFGFEEIRSTFGKIRSDYEPGGPLRILILDRGSGFNPSSEDVRTLVSVWAGLYEGTPASLALVVTRDLHYGLGRMASAFAEGHRLRFSVFRDTDDALEWLADPAREKINPAVSRNPAGRPRNSP